MRIKFWELTMLDNDGFVAEKTTHEDRATAERRRDAQMNTGRFGGYVVQAVWE
jgi:hypothetical protein